MHAMIVLLTAAAAAPVAAQAQAPAPVDPSVEVMQVIGDPATADRLTRTFQAMSKALLNLPVGEIAAAAEGRAPGASDRRVTVGDLGRREDPNFDRNAAERMAAARPMVEQSLKALGQALPAVMGSLKQAGEALERAAANMPDPTYPKR
jgi:hypothetical protein